MKKTYYRMVIVAFAVMMAGAVILCLPSMIELSAEKGSDPTLTLWEAPAATSLPAPMTSDSPYELIPDSSEVSGVPVAPTESTQPKPGPEWGPGENGAYNYYVVTKGEIHDGVYAFFNIGTYYGRMGYRNGALRMTDDLASPAAVFDTECLFRITRVSGTDRYIIRNLEHETLTLGFFDGEFSFKTIPANDADVKPEDTFVFTCYEHGFTITPYGSEASICCDTENRLVWGTKESCDRYARWYFERFMGVLPEEYAD